MNTEQPQEITEQKLAKEFAAVLKSWLNNEQMKQVVEENRKRNDNTCASQDFCDANMAMDEAFTKTIGRECWLPCDDEGTGKEDTSTYDCALWNNAWNIAKENHFYTNH